MAGVRRDKQVSFQEPAYQVRVVHVTPSDAARRIRSALLLALAAAFQGHTVGPDSDIDTEGVS